MGLKVQGWVLLIDTDRKRLSFVSQMLLASAMRVSCAISVQVAAFFLKDYRPDLILLHSSLPDLLDLIGSLKADPRLDGVPLFLLTTGGESAESLNQLFQAGIDDVILLPPPVPFVLCNRVGRAIEAASLSKHPPRIPVSNSPAPSVSPAEPPAPPAFPQLEGISYEDALRNCGGEDILKTVFQKFYESIEERSEAIEGYVAQGDWQNYRIAVHSLKSSARLIGALSLSDAAKDLEAAAKEQRVEQIVSRTPILLDMYRSYRWKLSPLFSSNESESDSQPVESALPLLSEKKFAAACSDMEECIGGGDFTCADFIVKAFEKYYVPESLRPFVLKIRSEIANENQQDALALLAEIKSEIERRGKQDGYET